MENIMYKLLILLVLSTSVFAQLEQFAVVDNTGKIKVTAKQVGELLKQGKTCVMHRASVRYHSKDVTKNVCRDKDSRERFGIRVIKCSDIAENNIAQACKGIKITNN